MTNKAMIAMSGGVDSGVAALILKNSGFDCIGATMKLYDHPNGESGNGKTCCSLEDIEDARSVAIKAGIPFYAFNYMEEFKREVMERFISSYENGETPNPCIDCNKYLKFDALFRRAEELGCDYFVTGHYARIERDEESGRYLLKKGLDEKKDQSYVLYSMTQHQLAHTLFPLGELRKERVREIAESYGLSNARKQESQDICFVPDGDYAQFIEDYTSRISPPGFFRDTDGNVLGEHKGIIRYTVGQRKGLGLSLTKPGYVCEKRISDNSIIVGDESQLLVKALVADNINLISVEKLITPIRAKARTRYNQLEQWATITPTQGDKLLIQFDSPQKAVAQGQAVVLYDGDTVIGGGRITKDLWRAT